MWEAENIRKQQEAKYLLEMDRALSIANAELAADTLGVRELFAQIQSRRSPDLERSHHRIERCEQLSSEA